MVRSGVSSVASYSTLIVGRERRRRWSEDQKLALVEATCAPGSSVASVAREADICTSVLYRWRRLYRDGGFAPVFIKSDPPRASSSETALIIELEHGRRVLISGSAPADLVSAALRALR